MKFNSLAYFAWQIGRMHLQPKYRMPLSIYIVLTNRCNNHCVYCHTNQLPQNDVWTTDMLKKVMEEMKSCGTRRIQLTGGEPMLREDLGEVISYAKKLDFFVGISTNGYQVAKRIDELKGVDVVFLSYDGPPEIRARLRGEKSVKDVESALSILKAAGICVWTTTVLTRWNASYIENIVAFAKEHHILANFTRLEFCLNSPSRLHPHLDEVQDLILRGDERKKVFQKLIQLKLQGAPIGSSLEYLKNASEWPYDSRITDSKPSKRYQCWAGRAWAHLDFDGMLYSCGWASLRNLPGINILEKRFKSAWEKLVPLDNCKSCSHACGVENNLIFSLNIPTILNALVQLYKR